MRLRRPLAALLSLLAAQWIIGVAAAADSAQTDAPACVKHRTEARYRNLGYDHLVYVHNACDAPVSCRISTNVRTDPVELGLRPGERREVLTWRGSPAREFTARVACQLTR
jgi:hypothetical protein